MCDCDCYPPEFLTVVYRVAKKPHRCGECLRKIQPGERYQVASGKWDGDFDFHKTCPDCVEFIQKAQIDCYCFGQLFEDANEMDDPLADVFLERRRVNYDVYQFERVFRDFSRLHL